MTFTKLPFLPLGLIAAGALFPGASASASTFAAPDDHSVLILARTVVADPLDPWGRSLEQAQAEAAGFTVVLAGDDPGDPQFWDLQDFSSYRAIVLGDPECEQSPEALAAGERTLALWGPLITGNVVIAGNAPAFSAIDLGRRESASSLISGAIAFAAAKPGKTGAYIPLSCYYAAEPANTPVPILAPFAFGGDFTVGGGCWDEVHKVAEHSSLAAWIDPLLGNWGCSANEAFSSFPLGPFAPVVINLDAGAPGALAFADGSTGVPYIVARGVTPLGCGNATTDLGEECDDGNTNDCDGCSTQCRLECGNGLVDCGEQCDDGNRIPGDHCSALCKLEICGNGIVDPGEQCDDGNANNNDACPNNCILPNHPPTMLCHPVSVVANAQCKANASINNGSFDPDGDAITCVQSPVGPYSPPTTNVTLTCTDSKNAANSCSAIVTVVDATPPVFTFVPPALTISVCTNANLGQASATDNCGVVSLTNNAPTKFPLGKTTVTWIARDAANNPTPATQVVTAVLGDDASCCPVGTHIIPGTSGADTISGTSGADCILGRGGSDTIASGDGVDYVSGGADPDIINSGAGGDWVYGGDGSDTLDSGDGNDHVFGQSGQDTIMAGNGSDEIDGGSSNDGCNWGRDGVDLVTSCEIQF